MNALKDLYSPVFYKRLAGCLAQVIPSFNENDFTGQIFSDTFDTMELKARMAHTATVLHNFLPDNFSAAVLLIKKLIVKLRQNNFGENGLECMFIPAYIEMYGINHYKTSINALEYITQYVSCEFAVRPFILKYGDKMIAQMVLWSLHESYKVRRFSSEGSRPRLPWAMALPAIKKDPTPILPILENLKNDPSEWVRRSVANSLNDITRDHPATVLAIAKKWKGQSKETDAIIKHGSRTLLKQGHVEILKHYGLDSKNIHLDNAEILTPKIKIGDKLEFSFSILNGNKTDKKIRVEYAIFYQKKNSLLFKKVFKISEKIYHPNEKATITRKQKFVLITTRKFYAGAHQLSIIINGEEKTRLHFDLVD